jgi:hypothetical protein
LGGGFLVRKINFESPAPAKPELIQPVTPASPFRLYPSSPFFFLFLFLSPFARLSLHLQLQLSTHHPSTNHRQLLNLSSHHLHKTTANMTGRKFCSLRVYYRDYCYCGRRRSSSSRHLALDLLQATFRPQPHAPSTL